MIEDQNDFLVYHVEANMHVLCFDMQLSQHLVMQHLHMLVNKHCMIAYFFTQNSVWHLNFLLIFSLSGYSTKILTANCISGVSRYLHMKNLLEIRKKSRHIVTASENYPILSFSNGRQKYCAIWHIPASFLYIVECELNTTYWTLNNNQSICNMSSQWCTKTICICVFII